MLKQESVLAAMATVLMSLCDTEVAAQIANPRPEPVCRALTQGDRFFPEFRSCCDIDGGHSRWVKADGSTIDRILICGQWGIKPAEQSLNLTPPPLPQASRAGIPAGPYTCTLVSPVKTTIAAGGRYSLGDGSSGRFELAERPSDQIGGFAKYRITVGSFDGFFFLHRDNGQLQVGRTGWGRCMPG